MIMIRTVLCIAVTAIIAQKVYRYYKIMGFNRSNHIIEYEEGTCEKSYKKENLYLNSTVDVDMMSNGMAIILNTNYSSLYEAIEMQTNKTYKTVISMLDLNQIGESVPIPLDIQSSGTNEQLKKEFNLFALSLYTDPKGALKMFAANYVPKIESKQNSEVDRSEYSIEKFEYAKSHHLIHLESYEEGLHFGQLCDLVAIEDSLFYFTKCHSSNYLKSIRFNIQTNNGEIWVCNLRTMVVYRVAKSLFMPKSIAYMRSRSTIVVTNLAVDGITLYRREFDNSLKKLQDISLDTFVFNSFVDTRNSLWIVTHPSLHKTFNTFRKNDTTPSQLYKLDFEYRENIQLSTKKLYYSTNGSSLNGFSCVVYHKNNLVLFSFLDYPLVCRAVP